MRKVASIMVALVALAGCGTTSGESTESVETTTTMQQTTTTKATTTTTVPPTTTTTIPHAQALEEMAAEIARACTEAVETVSEPEPEWQERWEPYSTSQEVAQQTQQCVDAKWAELKEAERQREEEERRAEEAARGTPSQQNAKAMASDYLDSQSFSRSGLIDQLEYEGFSNADATWGVDALGVDWNEQAARMAADYLDSQPFSRSGLVEQLVYEGFSQAEAEYGVSTTGL